MASLTEFDREQAILRQLEQNGRMDVNELAGMFQVSTVTIRKDLDALERRGMLQPLTVITNGLRVSHFLLSETHATVLVPGGVLRRASEAMVGFLSDVLVGRGRVDKGFFGLVGLSRERGLLDISPEEAHAKEALAAACQRVYALFDSTKVERFGMHSFVAADRVTRMVSDLGIPAQAHAEWTKAGVAWDLVDPDQPLNVSPRVGAVASRRRV